MKLNKVISITRTLYYVGRKAFELAKMYKSLKTKKHESNKKNN